MNPSVIQQQIIDGLFYWDNIAPEWLRLIHRASQDVVGHYKREHFGLHKYVAVRHGWNYQANGKADQRGFQTEEQARAWVEEQAKEWEVAR